MSSIHTISPVLISHVLGVSTGTAGKDPSAEDLMLIAKLLLLTHVHETMSDAWDKFRENQSEIRVKKEHIDRSREVKRHTEEGIRLEGAHRQELFVAGNYLDSSHRHLNHRV